MRIAAVVLLLWLSSAAQTNVLEFRGMRTGMTRDTFAEAIRKIAAPQGDKGKLECIPAGQTTLCVWGLYAGMFSGEKLVQVTYKIPLFERPISGFVDAFTKKFGRPKISHHSYQNAFGASFTGAVFQWYTGTQTLDVAEICSEIDVPCVRLAEPRLLKKEAPPPI